MSIKARDLVEFAADLIKPGSSEAALRAGVSRAYYAGYHALTSFAYRLPRSARCKEDDQRLGHTELVERLREWKTSDVHPDLPGMIATKGQLWRAVDAARKARVIADYRLSNEFSFAEAQSHINRVRMILRYSTKVDEVCQGKPSKASSDAN